MYRYTYWLSLALLLGIWTFGLVYQTRQLSEISPIQWLGSALFFSLYFLLPLFHKKLTIQVILLSSGAVIAMGVFWSLSESQPNHYLLLLLAYLAGEATYRLPAKHALSVGIIIIVSLFMPNIVGSNSYPLPFVVLYIISLGFALWSFHRYLHQFVETKTRYDALLHEYRDLKRRSISDEKLARQQERTQIGREIHDSVGHKLTNLLMQLEVARMEVDETSKERLGLLKNLASESLEETRRAVKALKDEQIGGIPAIISLIRKLEAENFIRIHFSVKNRAFSVKLDSKQTIAVYRAIQEALTNVMRHSSSREASVLFESPGASVFRFEVSNAITSDFTHTEGYGLKAMRDRVKQAGGNLEILVYQNSFIVRGTFPIGRKDVDVHDPSLIS